ncbi:MAG: TetR/AcrR family transcriptional regulator [Proteiniphilum sp.]|jgi:AcrR family transcriptional regulator|nr:TetR/AcrR family transcriptional regulator [Proteiniphilum sp.]
MPRTKEQNEAIRAEKRQLIMDTAMQLFAEEGYAHTSIDKIATQAGIAKGLVYTYFENKEDLLRQIFLTGVRKVLEAGLFQGELTNESLIDNIEKMFDIITEQSHFYKLFTTLSTQPGIAQRLEPLTETSVNIDSLQSFFQKRFGERAIHEMLLLSTLSKGYSILALFGNGQKAVPMDLLKPALMDFARERWGAKED